MTAPAFDRLSPELAARTRFLRAIAERAGRFTLTYFQHPGMQVDRKSDDSPVTVADRGCEELVRRAIAAEFPGDGMLGEEHGEEPGDGRYRWIIDPIDGTVSFARGVPLYGVLIAIEDVSGGPGSNRVVAGACELPALRERVWAASGVGAWWEREGEPIARAQVSPAAELSGALVGTTGYEYFRRAGCVGALDALSAAAGRIRGWSRG